MKNFVFGIKITINKLIIEDLIVIPAYIPDYNKGGSVTGCHSFAKICNESKMEVTVSTLDTCKTKKYYEIIDGIKVLRFKPNKFLNKIAKSGFGVSLSWFKWFMKNAEKYDIIYFRSIWNFTSLVGPLYCWIIKKPFGFCASGKLSSYAFQQSKWKKFLVLLFFHKIISKASFVHYATKQEYDEQVLKAFKNVRPIILPPSVEIPKVIKVNNKLKYYSVSRINPIKNIEFILENFIIQMNLLFNMEKLIKKIITLKNFLQLRNKEIMI